MTNVEARLRHQGKEFQVLVDFDKAVKFKKGEKVGINEVVITSDVFFDLKKGIRVPKSDLEAAFKTVDVFAAAEKIIKNGSIQIPAEEKNKEREDRIKQVIDFINKNAVDPKTKMPHTPTRIESAIKQAGINIDNRPVEEQIGRIVERLREILPIKIETKKLSVRVSAVHTGRVYGLLKEYKEKEEWLNNGDLYCIINIPVGMQMDFYDKLNAITHGSAIVEEIKE